MTTDTIELRVLDEQYTAIVYGAGDRADFGSWIPDAIDATRRYLQKWGAGPVGDPYVRVVDGEIEAGFTATTPVGGEGDVEPSELPAGSAAVIAVGSSDDVDAAMVALETWMSEHGAVPEGTAWEVLLDGTVDGRREVVQVYRSAPSSSSS